MHGAEGTLTDTMHIILTSVTVLLILLTIGFGASADGKWFRSCEDNLHHAVVFLGLEKHRKEKTMKILIAGSNGMIGSAVTRCATPSLPQPRPKLWGSNRGAPCLLSWCAW